MDSAAIHSEPSAVGFSFFRVYTADKVPVCDIFASVMGNVCFADESDDGCVLDAAPYTLGKETELVGRGDGPLATTDRVL